MNKKLVLWIVLIVLLVSGCDHNKIINAIFNSQAKGHELYYGDFGEINSLEDIGSFIKSIYLYRRDFMDDWKNPENTLLYGGDCEDYAILFINIAYVELGIKLDLGIVNPEILNTGKYIESGVSLDLAMDTHAEVVLDGKIISTISGKYMQTKPDDIYYYYTFKQIFGVE